MLKTVDDQQCDVACDVDGMRAVSAATLISIWTALATCQEAVVAGGMKRTGAVLRGDVVACSRAVLHCSRASSCSCTNLHASDC